MQKNIRLKHKKMLKFLDTNFNASYFFKFDDEMGTIDLYLFNTHEALFIAMGDNHNKIKHIVDAISFSEEEKVANCVSTIDIPDDQVFQFVANFLKLKNPIW